jgi:hypothetical protein
MDLLDCDTAATRLGVTVRDIEQMICDGTLFAVRFATGIRVVIDDPPDPPEED